MAAWFRDSVVPRLPSPLARRAKALDGRALPVRTIVGQRLPLPGPAAALVDRRDRAGIRDSTFLRTVSGPGGRYLASPLPSPDLTAVTGLNLETVVDVLEAERIEYFLVENDSYFVTAVAVRDEERHRLLDAMRARWTDRPVYISLARADAQRFEMAVLARKALDMESISSVPVLRVFRAYSSGSLTVADDLACDVEFWRTNERAKRLVAPRPNRVAPTLPADATSTTVRVKERAYRGLEPFSVRTPTEIDFPVDLVYTWVDGADPVWAARRDEYLGVTNRAALSDQAADAARYLSRDELRYSLRSVEMFAPWARHVYVVTDGQAPPWLDPEDRRFRVVDHREIFADPDVLPTFNSHAIESQLHHIDGLAEHYVYLNDDMLLGRPVAPSAFFHPNGTAKMFLSPARVDYGEPSRDELPVMAAAKNNRRLILDDFGRYVTQKQKHAPYPHRRSVMYEMEERYADAFARTAASRFRHPDDVSIAASLQQYYAFLTGRSVPATLATRYIDLGTTSAAAELHELSRSGDVDAFCLNDTDADGVDLEAQVRMVRSFLESFYPLPGSFERPHHRSDG